MIISSRNEPVTTNREEKFADLLDKEGVVYRRNHIFCFNCNDYFRFYHNYPPNHCHRCARTFSRGEYCIPDFIIIECEEDPKPVAIVMINEDIHYKNHKQMMKVKWQVKAFLDLEIPVIILREEDITKLNAQFVKRIIEHNDHYSKYAKSNKFKEDACFKV